MDDKIFSYEEIMETLKRTSKLMDEDLQHLLKCINRMPESALVYQILATVDNIRDSLEILTSETYFIAHRLRKELKKNEARKLARDAAKTEIKASEVQQCGDSSERNRDL